MEFSLRSMHQLIKDQGDKRVSFEAAEMLADELENHGMSIAEAAVDIANEEGVKTVKQGHIVQAIRDK